jgi:hypothetical protein
MSTPDWYKLSVTPNGGGLVEHYFKTDAGKGLLPITGVYDVPYKGGNLLIYGFYDKDSSYLIVDFNTHELQAAFLNATPTQATEEIRFFINGQLGIYTTVYTIGSTMKTGNVTIVPTKDPSSESNKLVGVG